MARHTAVIDIGKTNAKLALVDARALREIAVVSRPNRVLPGPPWPHFDVAGHWDFVLDGLTAFHAAHGVDAVAITTHGACAVWLDAAGGLAAPVLDYEHDGPEEMRAAYDALRPPFAQTGSPRLPLGLNLGAQLHWQVARDPGLPERAAWLLTYPQYWAYRLTGIAANDLTSLGCHTDLWNPHAGVYSALPARLGLVRLLPPARRSDAVLGPLLPEIAARTGLAPDTPVACGIHDSNASLVPHLMAESGPFAVVSTGTWVVVMRVGVVPVVLDEARDCLVNVNAFGEPVPSARFMGGREYTLAGGGQAAAGPADCAGVLARRAMLFPTLVPGAGPFAGAASRWSVAPETLGPGEIEAAVSFYLALVTAECLALTGASGKIIVEGPFAANAPYLAMLAAATGLPLARAQGGTGTSIGAALLFGATPALAGLSQPVAPGETAALASYAAEWRAGMASAA